MAPSRGGVNLDQLTSADVRVSEDGQVIRITLPAPEVLSVNVTEMQTYRFDTGLFGLMPPDPTLNDAALRSAQVQLGTLACNSGILELAATNAERAVEGLFMLMDGVEVLVDSRAPGACEATTP